MGRTETSPTVHSCPIVCFSRPGRRTPQDICLAGPCRLLTGTVSTVRAPIRAHHLRLESAVTCDPLRGGLQSPGHPSVPASMTGVHLSEGVSAGCPPGQLLFSLVTEPLLVGDTESQPCPFVHHDGFPAHRPSTSADDVLAKDQPSPFLPLLVSTDLGVPLTVWPGPGALLYLRPSAPSPCVHGGARPFLSAERDFQKPGSRHWWHSRLLSCQGASPPAVELGWAQPLDFLCLGFSPGSQSLQL